MNKFTPLEIAGAILAIALLLCLAPMPYGYYVLVRFLTMIIMACFAYTFYQEQKTALAVVAGAVAVLFQPFVKIALGREMWTIIDVVLAVLLIVYVVWNHHKKNSRIGD